MSHHNQVNTANITGYEEEEQYVAKQQQEDKGEMEAENSEESAPAALEERDVSLSRQCPDLLRINNFYVNVGIISTTVNNCQMSFIFGWCHQEDGMEEAEEGESTTAPAAAAAAMSGKGSERGKGEGAVIDYDYGLYKTFWDIQVRNETSVDNNTSCLMCATILTIPFSHAT
jgi:hypothetical protein